MNAIDACKDWLRRGYKAIVAILPQWVMTRVIVLGTLALANIIISRLHPPEAGVVARVHEGLLGWDAGWYETIARFGYVRLGTGSLRFFPLLPLATRLLAQVPALGYGTALLLLSNGFSLVGTALLFVLARRESGDVELARRAVWLFCLLPPAFTYVMGYSESMLLVCTLGCFLALRRSGDRHPAWYIAAVFGLLAALTRPLGVLLIVPIGLEAFRWRFGRFRGSNSGSLVAIGTALLAPVAGIGMFLLWAQIAVGNALTPITVQTQAGHHGGISDPIHTLLSDAGSVFHGHYGTALHVPWVILAIILLAVCWRTWPSSYAGFATAVVLVALSGTNLDSFERYALSAFPLVLVGAALTKRPMTERIVLVLAASGLIVYSLLAFLNLSVP